MVRVEVVRGWVRELVRRLLWIGYYFGIFILKCKDGICFGGGSDGNGWAIGYRRDKGEGGIKNEF